MSVTTNPLPDDLLAKATPFLTDEQLAELERQLIASEEEWQQYEGRGSHPAHDLLAFKAEEYIRRLLTDVRALHAAVNAYTGREREDTVREALEILREEGWLGRSEQRIAALANPTSDRSMTRSAEQPPSAQSPYDKTIDQERESAYRTYHAECPSCGTNFRHLLAERNVFIVNTEERVRARTALDETAKVLQEIATLDQAVVIQGEHESDVAVAFDRGALKHAEKTAEMARCALAHIAELTKDPT